MSPCGPSRHFLAALAFGEKADISDKSKHAFRRIFRAPVGRNALRWRRTIRCRFCVWRPDALHGSGYPPRESLCRGGSAFGIMSLSRNPPAAIS
jgi:hypothetical protein